MEDQSRPGHRHPDAEILGRTRGVLPGRGYAGVEGRARRRRLVDDRFAAVAVVADGGLAYEHAGARFAGAQHVDQVLGRSHPARPDPLLRLLGPALVNWLADQVDQRVDALEHACGRALDDRVPRVPRHRRIDPAGARRIAGQADDLIPAGEQRIRGARAEETAGAGDEDAHNQEPAVVIRRY
jgi:hypothetical protein